MEYTLVSKEELFSALRNLYHMPESDGSQPNAQIRRDTKRRAKRIIEIVAQYDVGKAVDNELKVGVFQ